MSNTIGEGDTLSLAKKYFLKTEYPPEQIAERLGLEVPEFDSFLIDSTGFNLKEFEASVRGVRWPRDVLTAQILLTETYKSAMDISQELSPYETHNSFSSRFKKIAGVTLLDYRKEARLGKVKWLLCHTDLPMKAIAERVGYNSTKAMYSTFQDNVDCSPTEYRERESTLPPAIERAKLLLEENQMTLEEIAKEMGYSTQANFGTWFKRETDETPGKYRFRIITEARDRELALRYGL